jgi:hypothetical protein
MTQLNHDFTNAGRKLPHFQSVDFDYSVGDCRLKWLSANTKMSSSTWKD